ncbi:YslB family protein [Lactobacillaceae bacterium 24-114]
MQAMGHSLYDTLLHSQRGLVNGTLRDVIIPSILGKETDEMLYWIGKDVARQFPVDADEKIILLGKQLGFGDLSLLKKNATSQVWKLGGPIVKERIAQNGELTSFGLETGFLAQEIEFQLLTITEATITERKKDHIVIEVKNDPKSNANDERTELIQFIEPEIPTVDEEVSANRNKRGKKKSSK